ncbi:hypothetical protein XELAEV_18009043mg [Xenopus laevis]|uniref:Uncharacterized protein n=1 Tax=Xenopus laevis TaxID=8355 RepID=A0A974I0F3_XENLA|nr:hypothetical protein XELAEV_18009043mg [Xenopus laevis]
MQYGCFFSSVQCTMTDVPIFYNYFPFNSLCAMPLYWSFLVYCGVAQYTSSLAFYASIYYCKGICCACDNVP